MLQKFFAKVKDAKESLESDMERLLAHIHWHLLGCHCRKHYQTVQKIDIFIEKLKSSKISTYNNIYSNHSIRQPPEEGGRP